MDLFHHSPIRLRLGQAETNRMALTQLRLPLTTELIASLSTAITLQGPGARSFHPCRPHIIEPLGYIHGGLGASLQASEGLLK